jgi:aryl-alcohol dehydrogenase-like predicted oxidoreductase
MNYRNLGKTGLQVSEIGLGGLFTSDIGGAGIGEIRRAVHRALELGVNLVDTAPTYSNSEETLGACLVDARHAYFLSTKLGGRPQPFNPKDRDTLRRSLDESLRLLRRESVDILMVHEPDRPGQYDWWDDWEQFRGPVRDLLADLKQEGLIRFAGLGGTTAYELPRVVASGGFDVVLTAFNYSLLWREAAIAVLPAAIQAGMGIIVGSPLQQGALARRYDAEVEHGAPWLSPPRRAQYRRLYAFVDELGIPLPELALRMVLSNPNISTVLSGARNTVEIESNIAAAERGPLPAPVLERLQEIADMVPFRPFEEPFGLPFGRDYRGPGQA